MPAWKANTSCYHIDVSYWEFSATGGGLAVLSRVDKSTLIYSWYYLWYRALSSL